MTSLHACLILIGCSCSLEDNDVNVLDALASFKIILISLLTNMFCKKNAHSFVMDACMQWNSVLVTQGQW